VPAGCRLARCGLGFANCSCVHRSRADTLEPVELEVSQEQGFGRIVLTFKDRTLLPTYDAVITGGVLQHFVSGPD
jgi:hypothetical protein